MKVVPKLTACPRCGVELEAGKGPGGLAYHGCVPGRSVAAEEVSPIALVEQAVRKPDLTMQEAGLCYARLMLHRLTRDPDSALGDPGSVLEGMAKFSTSAKASDEGGLAKLVEMLNAPEAP